MSSKTVMNKAMEQAAAAAHAAHIVAEGERHTSKTLRAELEHERRHVEILTRWIIALVVVAGMCLSALGVLWGCK